MLVQRQRSHDITQVHTPSSVSAATYGEPAVKLSKSNDFGSGLREIDRTPFEAKRLLQNPFSHGYRAIRHNKGLTLRISHAFGRKGPAIF